MTTLTLNSVHQSDVNSTPAPLPRSAPPSVGQSAIASVALPVNDSVSLSAAAQATGSTTPSTKSDLSDADASIAALNLRHDLGTQALSVTARQNQAIVSLLRS